MIADSSHAQRWKLKIPAKFAYRRSFESSVNLPTRSTTFPAWSSTRERAFHASTCRWSWACSWVRGRFGDATNQRKRCVVLDDDQFRYQSFCSDIAGQDIRAHAGKVATAIEIVRNWLSTTPPAQGTVIPSGSVIAGRYKQFRIALPGGCEKLQLNSRRLTFGDDVTLIVGWLEENPWKPAAA